MCCNISIKRGDNLKMAKATIQNKKRMIGILGFFAVFILYLVCHMFYWQLIKGSELSEAAYNQQTKNRREFS